MVYFVKRAANISIQSVDLQFRFNFLGKIIYVYPPNYSLLIARSKSHAVVLP